MDIVQGYVIEFISVPIQSSQPKQPKLEKHEEIALNALLEELLQKRVIEKCVHEAGEFISPVFLRPKKNGKYRMILNLKNLNKFISHIHFKMDTLQSCVNLMTKNCFMASLDLTDAYYSVSISPDSQKYLKFQVGSQLYKFITLPNGLSSAPRIFTKLMKPVYSTLRTRGLVSSGYLDDSFLLGDSFVQCQTNVNNTYTLFGDLGFNVSKEKSVTQPTQVLEHLGFVLNSINMTVSLTREKIDSITRLAQDILHRPTCSIREAAQLIGTLVSSSPGVEYGPLFYKQLEIEKIDALKKHKGSFEVQMQFSELARSDIHWWAEKSWFYVKTISHGNPHFKMTTDASLEGWGAYRDGMEPTGGRWLAREIAENNHINCLELEAAKLGLQALCAKEKDVHIHLQLDNVTAVTFLNNMGGTHSKPCNKVARDIWLWCMRRNIWLTATHIPGIQNTTADKFSRKFQDRTEWQLKPSVFNLLIKRWGKPEIDLFASRHNYQFKPFVSWHADPDAYATDAMCLSWKNKYVYIFPPFSMLSRILQKLQEDQARALVIAPLWRTQVWFPKICQMLISQPVLLPKEVSLLQLPHNRSKIHPLWPKLQLMACLLSGRDSDSKTFQHELAISSWNHGELGLPNSTECIWISGQTLQQQEMKVPFIQL